MPDNSNAIIPVVATQLKKVRSGNVLFNVVVLVVIAVMGGLNACEARHAAREVTKAAECLIEEFAEHREATRAAHQAIAEKTGATYTTRAEDRPTPVIDRLQAACAPFTKKN